MHGIGMWLYRKVSTGSYKPEPGRGASGQRHSSALCLTPDQQLSWLATAEVTTPAHPMLPPQPGCSGPRGWVGGFCLPILEAGKN